MLHKNKEYSKLFAIITGMKTLKDLIDEAKKAIPEISVDQARDIYKKGQAVFLDVRESEEYEEGVIKGAIRVPRGVLELQIERILPQRNREIVVYCAGGTRSVLAAKSLKDMGYDAVTSMAGGFFVWEAAGYEIETLPQHHAEFLLLDG
jgi:rhodanese-related sulfurtransferase